MGRDHKQQRRHGAVSKRIQELTFCKVCFQAASSSRAAELLQASGIDIQLPFLGTGATDGGLNLLLNSNQTSEAPDNIEAQARIPVRKQQKREPKTREEVCFLRILFFVYDNLDRRFELLVLSCLFLLRTSRSPLRTQRPTSMTKIRNRATKNRSRVAIIRRRMTTIRSRATTMRSRATMISTSFKQFRLSGFKSSSKT